MLFERINDMVPAYLQELKTEKKKKMLIFLFCNEYDFVPPNWRLRK